jgi:hypothetical protein
MLAPEQARAVLSYMGPKEWAESGYGSEKEYAQRFGATAGFGRLVPGAGGGDVDVDPYEMLMARFYRPGGSQALYSGQPSTEAEITQLAQVHAAQEVQSEVEKIQKYSSVEGVQELIRGAQQQLSPERFRQLTHMREFSKSQAGLIYNTFMRGMTQRITGEGPAQDIARRELGPLDLTAIDVQNMPPEFGRLVRMASSLKKSTGGYTTQDPETGEPGPGYAGSTLSSIMRQVVSDVVGMETEKLSPESRAAMLYDPGRDPETFQKVLGAVRQGYAPGVWAAFGDRPLEELTEEMPLPGYIAQRAAMRGMKQAGELDINEERGSARLYEPTERDVRLAGRGRTMEDIVEALGKKEIPLPQALRALSQYSRLPEHQAAARSAMQRIGLSDEDIEMLSQSPETRIAAQAAGPAPTVPEAPAVPQGTPPLPQAESEAISQAFEDMFSGSSTVTSINAQTGEITRTPLAGGGGVSDVPSAGMMAGGAGAGGVVPPTPAAPAAPAAPGGGGGGFNLGSLAGLFGEAGGFRMGYDPAQGKGWIRTGPRNVPFTEVMGARAQRLIQRIQGWSQGVGPALQGQRPFSKAELAQFSRVGGFMGELEKIAGSAAESESAPAAGAATAISEFQQSTAFEQLQGAQVFAEQQRWEQTSPQMAPDWEMLRTLDVEGLQQIRGVGPATAGAIQQYQSTMAGRLQNYRGIGTVGGLQRALSGLPAGTAARAQAGIMEAIQAPVGTQEQTRGINDALEELTENTKGAATALSEHKEEVLKATRNYENLSKEQQKAYNLVMRDVSQLEGAQAAAGKMGEPGQAWLRRNAPFLQNVGDVRAAQEEQERASRDEAYGGLTSGPWAGVGQAISGVGRRLMSGWGLMQMRRMWGMTGGYAMGQIPVAAQEEQAFMQAGMVGLPMGQYQPSGMALDIMGLQASQQGFRADVGRAAYGAWGWTQGAMGQGMATAAGIGLPAVGGGLMAGLGAGWAGIPAMAVGAPVAVAGGALGGAAWAGSQLANREQMAMAAARGPGFGFQGARWMLSQLAGASPGIQQLATSVGGPAIQGVMELAGYQYEQFEGLADYGQQILEGNLEGLGVEGRAASIGEAARSLTRRGQPLYGFKREQVAGQFADWARYTPGTTDVRGAMESDLFRTMMYRGETTAPYRQMAAQWGRDPTQWQGMANLSMGMSEPEFAQFQYSSQSYAPFARFGMTPEDAAGMPGITNAQQGYMMQRLAGGSQLAWSQFGMDTGQNWAVTQDPQSGMGIGTNWGGGILGGRLGQTGAAGREINVSGGDITFNVTGQSVGFNQWEMEDYGTGLGRGMQDWQYQFRTQGLDIARDYQYQQWGFQDEGRDLSRGYQRQQFGFQREGMAQGDRQFRERWQQGWNRMMAQDDWQEEDRETARQRQQTQFGWRLEDIAFRGARTSLQFGWQMEDLDESERFATGRDRRRIRRQRERGAIQFGMSMGQLETQEGRTRQQMRWADEEHNKAQERHNQTLQWRQQEMQLQLRHHTERLGLQQRRQSAAERYFDATNSLQDRQTKAARDYWEAQHERQREAIDREREHQMAMRELQDAQTALRRAQQLQINEFRAAFESGGPIRQAWSTFVTWARDEVNRAATSSSSRGYVPSNQYPRRQGTVYGSNYQASYR